MKPWKIWAEIGSELCTKEWKASNMKGPRKIRFTQLTDDDASFSARILWFVAYMFYPVNDTEQSSKRLHLHGWKLFSFYFLNCAVSDVRKSQGTFRV